MSDQRIVWELINGFSVILSLERFEGVIHIAISLSELRPIESPCYLTQAGLYDITFELSLNCKVFDSARLPLPGRNSYPQDILSRHQPRE